MRTIRAIVRSRSVRSAGSASTQARASVTLIVATSWMLRPSIVTASTSGRSRRPAQAGQGRATMYFSISVLMYSDSVSRKRRSRLVTSPSKVAQYVFSPRSWR